MLAEIMSVFGLADPLSVVVEFGLVVVAVKYGLDYLNKK